MVGTTAGAMAVLAGCGGGSSELTTEEQLEKLAGRPLTSAEVVEQLELADFLCGFDNRVLVEIWMQLDARQLEFQDYVFGQHCPERLSVYDETRPDTGTIPVSATTTTTPGSTTLPYPAAEFDFFDGIEPAPSSSTPTSTQTPSPSASPTTSTTTSTSTSRTTAGSTPISGRSTTSR